MNYKLEHNTLSNSLQFWKLEFEEDMILNNKNEKTIDSYSRVITYFIDFSISYDSLSLKEIDIKFIKYYLKNRDEISLKNRNKKLSVSTKRNDIKVLKIFFNFIEEYNNNNFRFDIKWRNINLKITRKEKNFHSNNVVTEYLNYLEELVKKNSSNYSYTISFCFKLALLGGLRASEICSLKLNSFTKTYMQNEVELIGIIIKGKGDTIFTNPIVYKHIEKEFSYFKENRKNDEFIFRSKTGKKLTRFILYRYIENIAKELNFEEKGIHIIRHTFANRLVAKGVDLLTIQDLMRHTDPATTRIYTQRNQKRMDEAILNL